MRVRFKGKDPRAGQEIELVGAGAERYIKEGLADEVKPPKARGQAADGEDQTDAPAPAAKKPARSR